MAMLINPNCTVPLSGNEVLEATYSHNVSVMSQDRTISAVQELPLVNQPECETNQTLLDLKPVA